MATNKSMPKEQNADMSKDQNVDKSKDQKAIKEDDSFYYVSVRASPYSNESVVFGVTTEEAKALQSYFPLSPTDTKVLNGIVIKGTPFSVINALAELGYRVICATGESDILWTLERDRH